MTQKLLPEEFVTQPTLDLYQGAACTDFAIGYVGGIQTNAVFTSVFPVLLSTAVTSIRPFAIQNDMHEQSQLVIKG